MAIAVSYEIRDAETGNIVAWYRTEEEALALVASYLTRNGPESVSAWFLTREDGQDRPETSPVIAEGDALARLAMRPRAGAAD